MDDNTEIRMGNQAIRRRTQAVTGTRVSRDGKDWYRIGGFDRMDPFFLSVVSGYDHWMFVSSTGGLTCGRRNADHALFPYETDDRIHDAHATAGPLTAIHVQRDGRSFLWEPFRNGSTTYRVERNLYKNAVGNRLIFEEINHDLAVAFEYEWSCSDRFGFVRRAALKNIGDQELTIDLLDGLRNILPAGVWRDMQSTRSTLVDAYRQAELHADSGVAIYTLSSIPTDRAEPSEALTANVAWQTGLDDPCLLLSTDQAEAFRSGQSPWPESERFGRRGDYLVNATIDLAPGERKAWALAAEVDLDQVRVVELLKTVEAGVSVTELEADIERGTARLRTLVGSADGFQGTGDALKAARHFSNTLFNIMRGGVFHDGAALPRDDFLDFVDTWNHDATAELERVLDKLGDDATRADLVETIGAEASADLQRLAMEYLPLSFSRRHGDPSRPWNHFDIDIRNDDGSDKLAYEGNWRDIFQNWEALAHSYPAYIESFIARFVNASTPDGYNPYRINRDGIDWEVLEPNDPWSNIGYWGDHQVNYLLKLVELSAAVHPGTLAGLLGREVFVYADVPYRIHGYDAMVANPYGTVDYDLAAEERIAERVERVGADGRLVVLADGSRHYVNLLEKLLVTALVRLGNLVPGGGIWMNTQRPEWNDANNALVGYGLSMVTLCYLRRFLAFFDALLADAPETSYRVSLELAGFFNDLEAVYAHGGTTTAGTPGEADRKAFVDATGRMGEAYRDRVYAGFDGGKSDLETDRIRTLLQAAIRVLDASIVANRRDDGLYHAYNLLAPTEEGLAIERLQVMLEGQVAVLASGTLTAGDSLALLDALRNSELYREDQASFTLYPNDPLPSFLDKNRIDPEAVENDSWIQGELDSERKEYVERDANGDVRFSNRFRNGCELRQALEDGEAADPETVERLGELFEDVFRHRSFTGRSGTMYKYEGLGCIYWHMVSKLLLEVGDLLERERDGDESLRAELRAHYRDIEAGLGVHKSPADYGAFPTDPYSHTPAFAGVQQPGMTGQVKEDIISRLGELGVRPDSGRIRFAPTYLSRGEFVAEARDWTFSTGGDPRNESLPAHSLAFCLCGVPVIYRIADEPSLTVHTDEGATLTFDGSHLDTAWSQELFSRSGRLRKIEVDVRQADLH